MTKVYIVRVEMKDGAIRTWISEKKILQAFLQYIKKEKLAVENVRVMEL